MRVAPPTVTVAKPQGLTYRKVWKFEITSVAALIKHVASNPSLANLLTPNTTAIRSLVTGQKTGFNVPGVRVWEENEPAQTRR